MDISFINNNDLLSNANSENTLWQSIINQIVAQNPNIFINTPNTPTRTNLPDTTPTQTLTRTTKTASQATAQATMPTTTPTTISTQSLTPTSGISSTRALTAADSSLRSLMPTNTIQPTNTAGPSGTPTSLPPSGMGAPPIIGAGFNPKVDTLENLEARYEFRSCFAFVYLVILVVYWFYLLYSLVIYYVRTSPYRRGIEHRSIAFLNVQTFSNIGAATVLLIFISYDYTYYWLLLIFLYIMLTIWAVSLIIRSLQLYYAMSLNFSRLLCYSVIKAGTAYELQEDIDNLKQFKNQHLAFINESQIDYVQAINYYQDKLTNLIKNKVWYSNRRMLMFFGAFTALMIGVMILMTNVISWKSSDFNQTAKMYSHPISLIFIVFFGLILFVIFPFFVYRFRIIKEARFLKLELIAIIISGLVAFIVMATWNNLDKRIVDNFSQFNFFFIMLFVSHMFAVSYPYHKLKNFMIVVSQEDFQPETRRKTISSFGSINSRFSLRVDDYRNKFVAVLDSPAKYRQFSNCANQYLCSPLVLFLDEYQTLKRRIITEFEQNQSLKTAYKTMLKLNRNSRRTEDTNNHTSVDYSFNTQNDGAESSAGSNINFSDNQNYNPPQPFSSENSSNDYKEDLMLLEKRAEKDPSDPFDNTYFNQLMYSNPISPTICSSLEYLFPSCDISSSHPVPQSLFQLFKSFYSVFIDPNSELNVGVHVYLTYEISQQIENNEYTLGMFDDAREEVLELLYFGVFPRYLESQKRSKRANKPPIQIGTKFRRFYRSSRA